MQEYNKASAWFEDLYKEHEDAHHNIPWARRAVNPLLQSYIDDTEYCHGRALVIGCGIGDDAYALDKAGYDVTAIDVSQTALEIAQKRFEYSTINFEKQDIFDMPEHYYHYFDFVFEALTIQSLPVEFREKMIKAVADTVAENGELLLVAHKKDEHFDGPPWPLEDADVALFKSHGLKEMDFEIHSEDSPISNQKFRVVFKRV